MCKIESHFNFALSYENALRESLQSYRVFIYFLFERKDIEFYRVGEKQKRQPNKGRKVRREREKERGERDRETPMNNSTKREKNDGYIYICTLRVYVCMYVCMFEIIFDSMMMDIYACALRLCMYGQMHQHTNCFFLCLYQMNGRQYQKVHPPKPNSQAVNLPLHPKTTIYKASSHSRINTTKPSNPLSHKSFVIKSICKPKSNNTIKKKF